MLHLRSPRALPAALSAILCVPMLGGRPARAEVIYVPDDYPTIQEAINEAAEAGDEIIVAEGEYNEAIDFLGKAIWLHSADGPEVTIIDGAGLDTSVVTCANGEGPDTVLEGFTITNGNAPRGGGMLNAYTSPMVINCIFENNTAGSDDEESAGGGGMFNDHADAIVLDCTFTGNTASINWFACGGGGIYNHYSNPTVSNCMFIGNTTTGYDAFCGGGGMLNRNSSPTLTGCTFDANRGQIGGGLLDYGEPGSATVVSGCTFMNNDAYDSGGAIAGFFFSEASVIDCTFSGNVADRFGGGMSIYAGTPTVADCLFDGNTADQGGGIWIMYSRSDITGCSFIANSAEDYGGGMYNETGDFALPHGVLADGSRSQVINATVTNCTFEGNTAPYGAGMCNYMCYGHGPTVVNCLFNGNFGLGALYNYFCWDTLPIINCTFTGNDAWGIANVDDSSLVIANCVLWGDGSGEVLNDQSEPAVTYCDVQGGYAGEGNIDADPLFVDPDGGDYRIAPGSPCIDAGDNTAVPPDTFDVDEDSDTEEPFPFDFDGNPRFVDDPDTEDTGHGEPPIADMGAYEYQAGECPADFDGDGDVDVVDLLYLLAAWGTPDGDIDGDGDTDTADLLALLAAWGECP